MVMESTLGRMVDDMKETMKMIGSMDSAPTLGTTEKYTKASGL
jgi:hypothetical protein